jgi:hypothetical protein
MSVTTTVFAVFMFVLPDVFLALASKLPRLYDFSKFNTIPIFGQPGALKSIPFHVGGENPIPMFRRGNAANQYGVLEGPVVINPYAIRSYMIERVFVQR